MPTGLLSRLFATRLARGTASAVYGQVIQLVLQLVSIPVFTAAWGLSGFGAWLLLATVPQVLALADLGITSAGANRMTAATARGDFDQALRTYSVLRGLVLAAGLAAVAAAALVFLAIAPRALDFAGPVTGGRPAATLILLACYGFAAVANGIVLAGFRAADAFARGGFLVQTVTLVEASGGLAAAGLGATALGVALVYLLARLAGSLVLIGVLRRQAPWLGRASWRIDRAELRSLAGPSLAAWIMPLANAVTLQGAVMAIGAAAGPAAVPGFATVRTLSRAALQAVYAVTLASMPRFTVAEATGDRARMGQLVLLNLAVAAALLIPMAAVLLVFGQWFTGKWTHGTVAPSLGLLAALTGAMLLNGAWHPLANLLLAINRHAGFTWFYFGLACLCTGLGYLAAPTAGATGMALAVLAGDAAMTIWVWRLARRIGIVRAELLAPLARQAWDRLWRRGSEGTIG